MKFGNGYKSIAGLAGCLATAALFYFDVLTMAEAIPLGAASSGLLGVGILHKFAKGDQLMREILEAIAESKASGLLIAAIGIGILFAVSPARAADCDFDKGLDAKVVRFAWPPAFGMDLAVIDFEVGYKLPATACQNVSSDLILATCAIPKLGDLVPDALCRRSDDE